MPDEDLTRPYTLISSDCHAGGSHKQYREYLEEEYLEDFDAWREQFRSPFKDLSDGRRLRNWDDDLRNSQLEADGVVGEVIFPNTIPPFFPGFVLFAQPPKPDDYAHRLAGIRAHNRWLVDFCSRYPVRRAGVGQIFINDVDDAIADARWIKQHGLRGGVLLPTVGPDVSWVRPLYDPYYEPLWRELEELDLPVNAHAGSGSPDYGKQPISMLLYMNEVLFYSQRPFVQLALSGVFERYPRLKFITTENGCYWMPALLERVDSMLADIRDQREGEIKFDVGNLPPRSVAEYFQQSCYLGVSIPRCRDVAVSDAVGPDRFMWGSDYPHDEGTGPFSRECLRILFSGTPEGNLRQILGETAAAVYHFDLDALAPLVEKFGPTVEELRKPFTNLPPDANAALVRTAPSRGNPNSQAY